ncbi:MAG: hypothetical protein KC621_12755 [Myxococcales bacterium]|nr:hypothetical protein [Myxococcales bacterium]
MWWVLAAFGAEPAPTPVSEEVLVEVQRLSEAREATRDRLKDLGYGRVLSLGHKSWFVNHKLWKPFLMVHDEGFARIRTVPLLPIGVGPPIEPPSAYPGLATGADVIDHENQMPMASFLTTSPRARKSERARIATTLEPYLANIRDASWALARVEREVELREELVAIWFDGLSADGTPLPTAAERRAALIERWLRTAPDEGGAWAREAIEAFVDDEVQPADPFTAEEVAAANARATFERRFEPLSR